MMSGAVEASVIIAAYNAASTLPAQLSALAGQEAPFAWEVLVCDNGSTDDTVAVARAWEDRLPLRVIDASAVRGPGAARNAGARAAKSPKLLFCDADDKVADGWLRLMADALDKADFAVAGARVESAHSTPRRPVFDVEASHRSDLLPALRFGGAGHSAVRTDALHDVGGFDETLRWGEDVDFAWRLQLAGYTLIDVPDAIIDISRRQTFIGTARQYFGYARGRAQLAHKYARVIAEFAAVPPSTVDEPRVDEAPPQETLGPIDDQHHGPPDRLRRAATYLRDPREFTEFVRRAVSRARIRAAETAGTRLGRRFARIDHDIPVADPAIVREYLRRSAEGGTSAS